MARLSRYLLRLFWSEAMALFAVAAFLLFLIQCLRLFDLVSDKGQNVLTLIGQALLTMPGLGATPAAHTIDIDENGNTVGLF